MGQFILRFLKFCGKYHAYTLSGDIYMLIHLWLNFLGILGSNCTNQTATGHFVVPGCKMIYTDMRYGMCYRISCSSYCYRFDHKTKTTKWVSLKFFVEEDDIPVDLLTKFQLDPVWNLRETIKTPVHCEMCCKFSVLHS
jgi:hypothetical protein